MNRSAVVRGRAWFVRRAARPASRVPAGRRWYDGGTVPPVRPPASDRPSGRGWRAGVQFRRPTPDARFAHAQQSHERSRAMSPTSDLRSPQAKPPAARRPAGPIVTTGFAAVAAFAAVLLAVGPAARADGERVRPDRIPSPAGDILQREAAGAREVQYYRSDDGYFVHFTLPNGLRLETKVSRDGGRVTTSPTANQPELSRAETRRAFERYEEDRRRAEIRA